MYLFLARLGLCGAVGFSVAVAGRSHSSCSVPASLCGGSSRGAWTPGRMGSVVVARGLSRSLACGIFLDWGLNPCPLF